MPQLLSVWSALTPAKRALAVAAAVGVFLAVLGLARLATTPAMSLLYAGIDPGAAGEVVAALEQQNVAHEVRGDSIWVDSARRDAVRMTLAAESLPAAGAAGYELLDRLSGFGTTAQMFDAAYWRAREGELARTIVASPHVRAARVHIAVRNDQPFRSAATPTASVSLTPAAGALDPAQVRAVRHLVAAAVSGLDPSDVAVIDAVTGLAPDDRTPDAAGAGADRARALQRSVERLLEAHVGAGNAVVEVALETRTDRETLTERRIDPESQVAISRETEERSNSSSETGAGGVTVASNLPDGDAEGGGDSARTQQTETRDRTNFEVSETLREVERAPGAIRRLTVAVLLDQPTREQADGTVAPVPRPEEELASLRDLVASAVGFDEARGDAITIETLPFEPVAPGGTLARQAWTDRLDPMALTQIGVLAAVALALGLFVLRPLLAARPEPLPPAAGEPLALAAQAGGADADAPDGTDAFSLPALRNRSDSTTEDPVDRLRRLIDARRDETVEILRNWMEDPEDRGGRN